MTMPRYLIVGGTSGIGLGAAEKLCAVSEVAVVGRKQPKTPLPLKFVAADLNNPESVADIPGILNWDRMDGLVYSAGVNSPPVSIARVDAEDFEKVMRVNVTGAVLAVKACHPLLKAAAGRIVLVNSIAGRSYSRGSGFAYTASKGALSALARQWAIDFAEDRILVNSVFPSTTLTPMVERALSPEQRTAIAENTPLGRLADIGDVSDAICFLIGPRNRFITGAGIDINGGQFLNG